jgi:DNA primase small subunit
MPKKNWLSSDLVFDLDAEAHSCGKFTCQSCFDGVKADGIKLIEDFLLPDFGLSRSEISVNFSGGRGYHVHVASEALSQLERESRREIADYIGGTGLAFDRFFWSEGKKLFGPRPTDGGYGGKFARSFLKRLEDDKFAISLARKLKKKEERDRLRSAIERGNWDNVGITKREEKLSAIFEEMKLSMSGRIDSNVTADSTKLIRMPDSLHGGSGLCARKLPGSLDSFEPMQDAVAFTGSETLKVKTTEDIPPLNIHHYSFGPIPAGEARELKLAAAIYLLCKKAAVLA